ncbi:MAG: sulfotransferase domain-containing protein [Erythrobacter sp.]
MSGTTPKLLREATVEARSRYFDSARWSGYQPRSDDMVIATYPKCGTTWMQRIVGMLVFQSADPFPVQESSPWPDMRMPPPGAMLELAESQAHRRFFKTHLPYDALTIYEGMKIIHVARDGRDAALSFHNHKLNYTDELIATTTEISMADPKFGTPYLRTGPDPAVHFRNWVEGEADHVGDKKCGYFYMENSYWAARHEPNLLMVHFADLKEGLEGEMRRIAEFLEIEVEEDLWPQLVEAAGFDAMKKRAAQLLPTADTIWQGGGNTFLHKGQNARWKGVYDQADLKKYDAKVADQFSPSLARWTEQGRVEAGDPLELPD